MRSVEIVEGAREDRRGEPVLSVKTMVHQDPRNPLDVPAEGFADRPQIQGKRLLETRKKETLLFGSADTYCYNPMK